MFSRRLCVVFVALVGWLMFSGVASAHPHGWVDLRVRVEFDDQGRVEALRQSWRMDPFYSLVVLEGLGSLDDGTSMAERLDQLGVEIRANLASQHFFTELSHDDGSLALGEVSEYTTMIVDKRLEFSFVLPLDEPLALNDTPLRYKIFDPSYYIEVVHEAEDGEPSPASLSLTGAPDSCGTQIVVADPDPAKVMQAAMLDANESGEEGLGRFFAETGVVTCES